MATVNGPSFNFLASSGATTYPLESTPDGTATAGSSSALNKKIIALESVVIEAIGSADGTITLSDHAGTTSTDIVLAHTVTLPKDFHFGPYGIEVPWIGIRAVTTGTGVRARVVFRYA